MIYLMNMMMKKNDIFEIFENIWYNKYERTFVCLIKRKVVKMRYKVLYADTVIGILEISSETGQHKYTPDVAGVEKVKNRVSLTHEMLVGTENWTDPIPFFKNRIENAKRFSHENDISTHTDMFRMVQEAE